MTNDLQNQMSFQFIATKLWDSSVIKASVYITEDFLSLLERFSKDWDHSIIVTVVLVSPELIVVKHKTWGVFQERTLYFFFLRSYSVTEHNGKVSFPAS